MKIINLLILIIIVILILIKINKNIEKFKVYKSNICDYSLNNQCPYPSKPYYNSYF